MALVPPSLVQPLLRGKLSQRFEKGLEYPHRSFGSCLPTLDSSVTSRGLCATLSCHRSPQTHSLYILMPKAILVFCTNFNTLVVYTLEILSNMLYVLYPQRGMWGVG